jgi:uncharacterized ParB-like nuclease family protein
MAEQIQIALIRMDGGTQTRAEIDQATVDEYAEAMIERDVFPPVDVYYDGSWYWLADGFHRVHAAKKAGKETIAAIVIPGTCRDAVLFSVGANAKHGLRRTNEDKRRAVLRLLEDEEWQQWSDQEIARRAGRVSPTFVGKLRSTINVDSETVRKTADGRVMDTSNIGRPKAESAASGEIPQIQPAPPPAPTITPIAPPPDPVITEAPDWQKFAATPPLAPVFEAEPEAEARVEDGEPEWLDPEGAPDLAEDSGEGTPESQGDDEALPVATAPARSAAPPLPPPPPPVIALAPLQITMTLPAKTKGLVSAFKGDLQVDIPPAIQEALLEKAREIEEQS